MRKTICILALLVLIGCAFRAGSGKFLATTAQTVDTAMKGFFIQAELGRVSLDQSNRVVAAFGKYQQSMQLATNAYALSITGTNQEPWLLASNALFQSQAVLLSLIR